MPKPFMCESSPKGRVPCEDLAATLLGETARTAETDNLIVEMIQTEPISPSATPEEAVVRYLFEVDNPRAAEENPYDRVVEYEYAEALAWCAFAEETGLLCATCPLRAFLPPEQPR